MSDEMLIVARPVTPFSSGIRRWSRSLAILAACIAPFVEAHEDVHGGAAPPGPAHDFANFDTAERGTLSIEVRDETGTPTPALLGFQKQDSWEWVAVPQTVLPNPRHSLQRSLRHQWRTRYPINSCGQSTIFLPPGEYVVHTSKGLEYETSLVSVTVATNEVTNAVVNLRRFVNWSEDGWWAGDTHVHAARLSPESNAAIQCAAAAEDIHVASILLMGSPEGFEFPQYALGTDGTFRSGDFWLVPGQEGPRTDDLGHVIMLNTQRVFSDLDNYWDYEQIFRTARSEGAMTGLAHYYEEKFFPERSAALLFHQGLVDFVELLDDTNVFKPEHYYQALNLGYRLPLTAGSDFPWGDHIGDQRTYANIGPGRGLSPSAWYEAIRAGRSFVSQGPLIDLAVNGVPIGGELRVKSGDILTVRVTAQGYPRIGDPKKIWAVALGEELQSMTTLIRSGDVQVLEFEMTATNSIWIAAVVEAHNYSIAHTSPIYVIVDDMPIRAEGAKLNSATREMLERLQYMRDMELGDDPEAKKRISQSIDRAMEHYSRRPYAPIGIKPGASE